MRKLIVSTYVTLDGVMEAPENWSFQFWTQDMEEYAYDQLLASDALLMGRKIYDIFASSWPSRGGEFADRMNGLPKYVVSNTLDTVEWNNATLIRRDVADEVARLKQQPGQNILMYGSADLMETLIEHDLVDVYRIWVNPTVLGSGKRLFRDGLRMPGLKLAHATTFDSGVVVLTYHPARQVTTG
jgi:dihydrofolate reductase